MRSWQQINLWNIEWIRIGQDFKDEYGWLDNFWSWYIRIGKIVFEWTGCWAWRCWFSPKVKLKVGHYGFILDHDLIALWSNWWSRSRIIIAVDFNLKLIGLMCYSGIPNRNVSPSSLKTEGATKWGTWTQVDLWFWYSSTNYNVRVTCDRATWGFKHKSTHSLLFTPWPKWIDKILSRRLW